MRFKQNLIRTNPGGTLRPAEVWTEYGDPGESVGGWLANYACKPLSVGSMIERVTLKFGAAVGINPLMFTPGPLTLFVGPNNSGKSLVLREIEGRAGLGEVDTYHILDGIELVITREDVEQALRPEEMRDANNERTGYFQHHASSPYRETLGGRKKSITIRPQELERSFSDGSNRYTGEYLKIFSAAYTLRLDGQTRLTLTLPQQSHPAEYAPSNLLMALLRNSAARRAIRIHTANAFGLHFVIDPTGLRELRIRMALHPPADEDQELSVSERGREFHAGAKLITELSDGVKAFTGLVSALFGQRLHTVLIDEPEAFLHPPLARQLGQVLTNTAVERGSSVFAATHSEHFTMGCIQSGHPIRIIRLTYEEGHPTARMLESEELRTLMFDPLLRSTGVLSALFHRGAVVCEGDVDRACYEEINHRLTTSEEGASDVLFANAVGKQTIRKVIGPLRRMGIPAAAIVDLDILKEGDLRALLLAANVPDPLLESWTHLARKIRTVFTELGLEMKTAGLAALPVPDRTSAEFLLRNLMQYGVFIVPVGEVEEWLADLRPTGKKSLWLASVFELMRTSPTDPGYVHPRPGDVWDFMRAVAQWLQNPLRSGMVI